MTIRGTRTASIAALSVTVLLTAGCGLFTEEGPDSTVQEELEAFAEQLEGYHDQEGTYPDDGEAVDDFIAALDPWPITGEAYAQDSGEGLGNGRASNFLYCLPGEANDHGYAVVAVAASGTTYSITPDGTEEVELSNPEHSADICADGGAELGTTSVNNDHRYWVYPEGSWRGWVEVQDQQDS